MIQALSVTLVFASALLVIMMIAAGWGRLRTWRESRLLRAVASDPELPELDVDDGTEVALLAALDLLRRKAPEAYETVKNNAAVIKSGESSYAATESGIPTIRITRTDMLYSRTHCAGCLYHEALHLLCASSAGEPRTADDVLREERFVLDKEVELLRRLNAPKHEVDHIASHDGTHSSVWQNAVTNEWAEDDSSKDLPKE